MHNFPGTIFLCQFPLNLFDYNNILISMKKVAEQGKYRKSYFPTT